MAAVGKQKVKFYIAGGGAVLALFALGWFWLGAPVSTEPAVSVIKAVDIVPEFEVFYTDKGYSPSLLEIPVGSRVVFKNQSGVPMWTASDPHPTHTDFAEFDSKKDYLPGQAYAFEFNKTGTFSFHNHEKSIDRGIIKVADPASPLPNIDKTGEGQRKLREKFFAMLKPGEPASVFKMLDAIQADKVLSNDCHDLSHDLGHKAYELYGFSGAMTFSDPGRLGHTSVDDICAGGYMHGILEEVFLHQPELRNHPANICSPVPASNQGSCFHGVGHGLMFINKRNVAASLADCRGVGDAINVSRCFEGVWMEMFWGNTDHAGGDSLGWTQNEPLVPCQNAKEDEKPACFLYAHLGYLRTHRRDFTGAVNLCVKSGLGEWDVRYCLRGVGITMMKHFGSKNLEATETMVAGFNYGRKYAYYQGVIGYARLSSVTEKALKSFCGNLKEDTEVCLAVQNNEPR